MRTFETKPEFAEESKMKFKSHPHYDDSDVRDEHQTVKWPFRVNFGVRHEPEAQAKGAAGSFACPSGLCRFPSVTAEAGKEKGAKKRGQTPIQIDPETFGVWPLFLVHSGFGPFSWFVLLSS